MDEVAPLLLVDFVERSFFDKFLGLADDLVKRRRMQLLGLLGLLFLIHL